MRKRRRLTWFAPVFIGAIQALSLTTEGQSLSPDRSPAKTSGSMLPRNVIIPLSTVNRLFPEVTREASTGHDLTSVANPQATRSVIYTDSHNVRKVTITVDQYATEDAAVSAYQEALTKSKAVPGFRPVSAENLGQNAFVGAVTQGKETHIGVGALHGMLIVGATLAGYNSRPENIAKLISLTREEERLATGIDRNE